MVIAAYDELVNEEIAAMEFLRDAARRCPGTLSEAGIEAVGRLPTRSSCRQSMLHSQRNIV